MSFNETNIRWTDFTLNFIHGCSKVSEGCKNCYAERVSHRFGHTEEPWTVANTDANIELKRDRLTDRLDSPAWVFINSMSDLFHPAVPPTFVGEILHVCSDMGECAFQVLTKHGPETARDIPPLPRNVMLGVSVESQRRVDRLDWLREQDAATKFVSFEPLVECVPNPDLAGVDWAIIGGESHPAEDERREMDPAWARNLVRSCRRQDVAVFFKQHSGARPESDVELDMGDGPERIEEFPELPHGVVPAPREYLAGVVEA